LVLVPVVSMAALLPLRVMVNETPVSDWFDALPDQLAQNEDTAMVWLNTTVIVSPCCANPAVPPPFFASVRLLAVGREFTVTTGWIEIFANVPPDPSRVWVVNVDVPVLVGAAALA
jgi:hypothetical protein